MVNKIEKKILVGLVILFGLVAVGATIILTKKKQVESGTIVISEGVGGSEIISTSDESNKPNAASSEIAFTKEATPTESKSDSVSEGDSNGSNNLKKEKGSGNKSVITSITWEDLYKLDYKTGKAPDSLKKLHKTKVKIPGFIVPLSDDLSALKDFLLVPNAQACIHVPPPPPNLIVYVILDKALPIEKVANPSWIEGTLLIETTQSEYGAASYKMLADKMVEYKF